MDQMESSAVKVADAVEKSAEETKGVWKNIVRYFKNLWQALRGK